MDRSKNRFSPPAVGGVSLLVVFAVLCLTVFALLSLATVQADVRLADASAQAVAEYYAADCEAQAILARLRAGERLEGVESFGGIYAYTCPISATQELHVEVWLKDGQYKILQWEAMASVDWESDDTLELWDGNGMF